MGVVPSVRDELVGPVHTTSKITPSIISSSNVMEQVRVIFRPLKVEVGEDDTITDDGGGTMKVEQRNVINRFFFLNT